MSFFAYRQYYPSLSSELSHRPYSPRIKHEVEDALPLHHDHSSSQDHTTFGSSSGRPGMVRRYTDEPLPAEQYEMDGTVVRPDPGSLEDVWRQGEGQDSVQEAQPAHHRSSPDPIR